MKEFIYKTPFFIIVFSIATLSGLLGFALVPLIKSAPNESYLDITVAVVIPSFFIAFIVSSPVVYFYRKIIDENYRLIDELKKDHLTGLLNRHTFIEKYNDFLAKNNEQELTMALIMVDLDNFKEINDKYGHPAGDQVIIHASNILLNNTRKGDLVGRFGGEEFLICLWNVSFRQAEECGNRILEALRTSVIYKDNTLSCTGSIGLAYFVHCSFSVDEYLVKVDKELYKAKHSGKNKLVSEQFIM